MLSSLQTFTWDTQCLQKGGFIWKRWERERGDSSLTPQDHCNNLLTLLLTLSLTPLQSSLHLAFFFFWDFIYLFLERGEGGEKGRETSMCGCPSHTPYWEPGLQPRNSNPDWESNKWPFASQSSAQSTEPHQLGSMLALNFRLGHGIPLPLHLE